MINLQRHYTCGYQCQVSSWYDVLVTEIMNESNCVNSLRPAVACMPKKIDTSLVQVMAWRRTGAKPLLKPMMINWTNLNQNARIFIHIIAFKNVVCKIGAILHRPWHVNQPGRTLVSGRLYKHQSRVSIISDTTAASQASSDMIDRMLTVIGSVLACMATGTTGKYLTLSCRKEMADFLQMI